MIQRTDIDLSSCTDIALHMAISFTIEDFPLVHLYAGKDKDRVLGGYTHFAQ